MVQVPPLLLPAVSQDLVPYDSLTRLTLCQTVLEQTTEDPSFRETEEPCFSVKSSNERDSLRISAIDINVESGPGGTSDYY
jgi:hypothetical protein